METTGTISRCWWCLIHYASHYQMPLTTCLLCERILSIRFALTFCEKNQCGGRTLDLASVLEVSQHGSRLDFPQILH